MTTAACLSRRSKNQVGAARERQGRNTCSTLLIVDAQSVKNTDTATLKGYEAGKKVSGIKRHIAVDTQGLPHAVAVTTAEVTDPPRQDSAPCPSVTAQPPHESLIQVLRRHAHTELDQKSMT